MSCRGGAQAVLRPNARPAPALPPSPPCPAAGRLQLDVLSPVCWPPLRLAFTSASPQRAISSASGRTAVGARGADPCAFVGLVNRKCLLLWNVQPSGKLVRNRARAAGLAPPRARLASPPRRAGAVQGFACSALGRTDDAQDRCRNRRQCTAVVELQLESSFQPERSIGRPRWRRCAARPRRLAQAQFHAHS